MVTKDQVLELVAYESRRGGNISYEDLMEEFDLSVGASCDHLKRLWEQRLIESVSRRHKGFKHRLHPGETILGLSFRLTPRGLQRLQWYRVARG